MAKLILLLATFALFLLLANASIYRTSVEIDDENLNDIDFDLDGMFPSPPFFEQPKSCRREFQAQHQLRACQRFLRKQSSSPRDDIEEEFTEEDYKEVLQHCCQQLKQIDVQCRCPALKRAVKLQLQRQSQQPPLELELPQQQGQQGQGQQLPGLKVKKMFATASNLPSMCQIAPKRCPFKTPGWWLEE